ncbi:RAMP superfamily CRISPR-associated protein [Solwaraspora sp. WMMD792]|uniref:RAMP superfamily CRISPR-associated protein n=1 Tax=Solwaraspora sp. WMMD792 TaxID=3016099 RepID=UPI0024168BF9|nr:RAMP superfamily CRISPR-associated protein [Solwaraspora sp. WMMD792]MDG4771535.1 RAMP superfamily CRISPR-associated protein [Solwaraspora sp. WMMD792]
MTLPTTFEITLKFLSDWHIGTGQGRLGSVDAEVRRDSDHLPFVPAKTIVGIWRDACETAADTFDRGGDRPAAWRAWVDWLFGTHPPAEEGDSARTGKEPTPAVLRVTPARAPAWLRDGVRGQPTLAQAAVVLRPGVKIDDETGTAADRFLRVEERALRGMLLHARVSVAAAIPGDPDRLPAPAELLLRAGARLVEAVGGRRNRGGGRAAFLLPGAQVDGDGPHATVTDSQLVELLAGGVPADPPAPPPAGPRVEVHPYDRLHPDRHRVVRVVLRVRTPVVAVADVLGNVISGHDSIPGTMLLGTVLRRTQPGPSADGGGRARIGLADVRVGDAVPAIEDPRDPASVVPARPVPMVWHRSGKGRGGTVRNILGGDAPAEEQAKPMSGWVVPNGTGWRPADPAKTVSTHAVVDDVQRRPTVASGGLFTNLGIAAGTVLCSDIVLPEQARLRLDPGEQLRFGRSRKDDFGLVEVVRVIDPLPTPPPPTLTEGQLLVWCVSDVLLRDERLAPDPSPQGLARALSAALAPVSVEAIGRLTAAAVRREGFGVAWGRPRSSQVALRAGSVVRLTVTGQLDPAVLSRLERDGIGERTVEGYGRIRFNPSELSTAEPDFDFTTCSTPSTTRATTTRAAPTGSDGPTGLAEPVHPIELQAWRRAIRRASAELRPEEVIKGIDRLAGQRAQLGSLRAQLERLTLPGGADMVRDWLAGTRAVRARRETWTEPVLDDLSALLLTDRRLVWERFGLAGAQPTLVLAPGREDTLREQLHTEALLTAVTAALRSLGRTTSTAAAGTRATTGKETS